MIWKDIITLAIAVLGAGLGILNTWHVFSQRRVRLRVRPLRTEQTGLRFDPFVIEVTNLSTFPVTVDEVGLLRGRASSKSPPRFAITQPEFVDGKGWPRRLEPRETVSVYYDPTNIPLFGTSLGEAYAKTACGEIATGDSSALASFREVWMEAARKRA